MRGQRAALSKENAAQFAPLHGAIWIHAASVGEFEQARPIIERIKNTEYRVQNTEYRVQSTEYRVQNTDQKTPPIVVTFFSPSGYEARKNYELADGVFYLPFPTRRNARRFLDLLRPKMAIFVKYEFWPSYIRELHKQQIPTYSISAIFRPKQYFFRFWGKRQLQILRLFTRIFVQDEASLRLLSEHGVENATVAGDTRFDRMAEVKSTEYRIQNTDRNTQNTDRNTQNTDPLAPIEEFVEGCERVIIAGSTWPKDEELLAQFQLRDESLEFSERTKLILVPHEIDEAHMHYIFNLFQGRYVKYSAISQLSSAVSRRNILQRAQVMVVDRMGLLNKLYRFGQVAYIGGGFGVGIHNTIEAAVYGLPVVFGPNYHHFREAKGLIAAGAAQSIKNEAELEAALCTALEQHESMGAKAATYVQSELGATTKIYEQIFGN